MLLPRRYNDYQLRRYILLMMIIKSLEDELLPKQKELYEIMSKPYLRKLDELKMNINKGDK